MSQSEKPSQAPIEERLRAVFRESAQSLIEYVGSLDETHYERFNSFLDGIATNGVIAFWGTKKYEEDMKAAGSNAWNRPFGIEMDTLQPNIQLVLYPTTIYKPDEEQRQLAKEEGLKVREEGSQVMVYYLDESEKEIGNIYDFGANLLFISHMIGAALNTRYPLEAGEKSQEFLQEVRAGMSAVRDYVQALTDEQRIELSPRIAKIGLLDEAELEAEAKRRVLYHAEPMKIRGLIEPETSDDSKQTPEEAVKNGTLYLRLDERDLPQRVNDKGEKDVPSLPWVEYGKNRWNRSHQLFGRYEARTEKESLLVDFRLDSTHMPAKYGFFDTIEILLRTPEGISQHVILSQGIDSEKEQLLVYQMMGARIKEKTLEGVVFPIVIAGDFDFSDPETRRLLDVLAQDKGTKPDVGRVIADVLRLSAEERLQRIQ